MIKLSSKVLIVALTGVIVVSVGCNISKVRMDGPLNFAVDTVMLPINLLGSLVKGNKGSDKKKAALKEKAATKEDDIKEISSALKHVKGIDDGTATILYEAGLTFDSLSTTSATDILYKTKGGVKPELAKAIKGAVEDEVKARKDDEKAKVDAAKKKAKADQARAEKTRGKVINAFKGVGISDGNATRIYDDEGIKSFEALSKDITLLKLKDAGLADDEDVTVADTLLFKIQNRAEKLAAGKADRLEKKAEEAEKNAKTAQEDANKAQEDANKAQEDANKAQVNAAEKQTDADTAQKTADAAKIDAEKQRAAFPPKKVEEKEKNIPALPSADEDN